ncbi:Adenosine deaminase related growth factor [Operophtera brumata]|uniref:Adenosine deaminase n=1 Tax=Operophtera brumata TaxID=104452 RepID=A0A0L7LNV3_OPEBR|nr:Adenosine deaminase related growth factor [Operophtera brumata]
MNAYTIAFAFCLFGTNARFLPEDYNKQRNVIINEEILQSLGGRLALDEDELAANEIIMKWKREEVDKKFRDKQPEELGDRAEKSKVYQIIRKMPKGAALHIHSSYMLDVNSMIALTHEHEDNLYACYPNDNDLKFQFSNTVPTEPCPVNWVLLSELRNKSGNTEAFDEELKRHFCFTAVAKKDPYESINDVWKRFEKVHKVIKSLITFRPVREKFFYKALEKLYDDNVMYVEIRSGLNSLYELDGSVHERMYMARLYKNITDQFIETHPDFMGFKFILTAYRAASNEKVREAIDLARDLKREIPEIFAGFDLVGQEDLGRPLTDFLPEFAAATNEIDFYFHGGETNWFGTSSDENLVDAILLGTKRIGHGYALLKHPGLMSIVKQRDIPIEVNVVSNSVLSLVHDVRNHPLASYLALDMPVVLSSDDPSAFRTDPLSHDFYLAFVSVASRHYDLRLLKTLALNSIKYSALDDKSKDKMNTVFNENWSRFIKKMITTCD